MRAGTFAIGERARAIAWKESTATLPPAARAPGQYDGRAYPFCLPGEYATLSLLPEVRERALALFAELGIPWHGGRTHPSNHLLSSQVQCVNALGQMVDDPARIVAAFGQVLDIDTVLEIEPGRYLTFEYIGETDWFNESPDRPRTRGAKCTSVDAAFRYRTSGSAVELALVEWKYTETYDARAPQEEADVTRRSRYWKALSASDGPVRGELLDFTSLCDEPLYQLVRQQLLAHELEKHHAEGADVVRVVHVLSPANDGYQRSLHRDDQRALGATVSEVWQELLRHRDRFVPMDSAVFLDPAITSADYVARYGDTGHS